MTDAIAKNRRLKFHYSDSMDLLNALTTLAEALAEFGVTMEVLDGGDGYDEVQLTTAMK